MRPKPLMLIIMDGWGWREERESNAIAQARTPNWNSYLKKYPYTTLECSGEAVGVPKGVMGNSEVGHLNIGAGRVVMQDLSRINKSISEGKFFKNKILKACFRKVKKSGGTLHLMGLLSDAGVHSHIAHLFALLDFAKKDRVKKICVHCFMDGRDTSPTSGVGYVARLDKKLEEMGEDYKIATITGRYYAMDRDKRWERIEKAYNAIVSGLGHVHVSAIEAVEDAYKNNQTDEFIEPAVIKNADGDVCKMVDGDAAIFFNFRSDRARQLTRALMLDSFNDFERKAKPEFVEFVTMTQYDETFGFPVAFAPESMKNILGEVLSNSELKQLRIAETEKYAHVTFFFDGGNEKSFSGVDKILIPSPKEVATYDLKPEMSAPLVTEEVLKRIESNNYDVIVLNFANADMVGHSGRMPAVIHAIETVDKCVGSIVGKVLEKNGRVLLTADHGNSEQMIDEDGGPHTSHTTNPVPFIYIRNDVAKTQLLSGGKLSDIAPTILDILKIKKPREMTGHSLIIHKSARS